MIPIGKRVASNFISCAFATHSPAWQSFMTCDVNKEAVVAAEAPTWQRPPFLSPIGAQPPPFQCRPGTDPAGYWDESTKRLEDVEPFPNSYGRVDLDGCCFWGRGSLSTRGSVRSLPVLFCIIFYYTNPIITAISQCNYGKVNLFVHMPICMSCLEKLNL